MSDEDEPLHLTDGKDTSWNQLLPAHLDALQKLCTDIFICAKKPGQYTEV